MKDRIYYDGKCDFCLQMVNFLELDKTYELFDLHKVESVETPEKTINKKTLEEEIHLITQKKTILKGGYALREILNTRGIIPKTYMKLISNDFAGHLISIIYRYISNRRSLFNHLYQKACSYSNENSSDVIKDFFLAIAPLFIFTLFLSTAGSTVELKYILIPAMSSFFIQQTLFFNRGTPIKKSPLGSLSYYVIALVLLIITGLMGLLQLQQTLVTFALITAFFTKIQKKINIFAIRAIMRLAYGIIGIFLFYVTPISTSIAHVSHICFWLVFFGNYRNTEITNGNKLDLKARETIDITSALIKLLIICAVIMIYLV